MNYAPIALFTYNRLWHTKKTIETLLANKLAVESDLYIFSDGPNSTKPDDINKINELRSYFKEISGFKSINIINRESNIGLAQSIIEGVSQTITKFGKVIVLEDDMVTSPFFLNYMNDGLNFYENDSRVISIHGYIYPTAEELPELFFLRGADCWGWATWQRGWDLFNPNGQELLNSIKKRNLINEFNFNNAYDYLGMLQKQIEGKNNSWAIRWYASAFLQNKLTLYPGKTLVKNIGVDNSGTHCDGNDVYLNEVNQSPVGMRKIPVKRSDQAFQAVVRFFSKNDPNRLIVQPSWLKKMFNHLGLS